SRAALICSFGIACNGGKLIGARDAQLRPSLQNPCGRDTHVIILLQRSLDQLLWFFSLKTSHHLLSANDGASALARFLRVDARLEGGGLATGFLLVGPAAQTA